MTLDAALAAEREAIDADVKYRRAKAERFLQMINGDGVTHPIAWKRLDADDYLIELERQARYTAAEAKAAWMTADKENR